MADIVPKDDQSRVFGNFNAVMGVAFIICPVAGGYLYEVYTGFSAIVVILCTAVFINIGKYYNRIGIFLILIIVAFKRLSVLKTE